MIGVAIGLGMSKSADLGIGKSWEQLLMPPGPVAELIPFGEPPLFIKITDGKTYYYSDWHGEGWLEKAIPEQPIGPFDVTKPCDYSFHEFSSAPNSPKDIQDCFQEITHYADGNIRYAFVLDKQGRIWEWRRTVSPADLNGLLCFPALGLVVGVVIALIYTGK
jgi:hypothetical protein